MFLAHGPVSYLANETIQKEKISGLKNSQQIFVAVLSIIFGVLPDLDFLLIMMTDRPPYTHHDVFTHTPIYWVAIWLLLFLLSKIIYPQLSRKTKQFLTEDLLQILLNAFLIAGISHFLADWLVGNIMLFYPLSTKPFTVFRYIFEPSYFTGYFLSVYFAIEIIIISIFLLVFSRKFLKKHKWDDIVAHILITLSVVYLGFSVFINLQTYNNSFLEEANNPYMDYDIDYDALRDTQDMDVDNDGVDNILDADYESVVENAKNVIASHKLAIGENHDFKDKVFLKFGALNSYRLVSQAFYEDHSPIEPVLKNYYITSTDQKKYTVDFDHQKVLKDYLSSKNLLIDLNLDSDPILPIGKMFFLINEDEEIINMGITLGGNDLGIVLPGEQHVQKHTLDGILKFYGDTISTFQIVR
jgi:inner membrane protein